MNESLALFSSIGGLGLAVLKVSPRNHTILFMSSVSKVYVCSVKAAVLRELRDIFTFAITDRRENLPVRHINVPREAVRRGKRRYWEYTLRHEQDLANHAAYIHFNPVKYGYVQAVAGWPYSTFHRDVARGLVPANWAGEGTPERLYP